jgi:hypothetical protein
MVGKKRDSAALTTGFLVVNEYKDWKIDGALVDQVLGTARRAAKRMSADVFGVVVWCRDFSSEAAARAKEHSENENIRYLLKRVEG